MFEIQSEILALAEQHGPTVVLEAMVYAMTDNEAQKHLTRLWEDDQNWWASSYGGTVYDSEL